MNQLHRKITIACLLLAAVFPVFGFLTPAWAFSREEEVETYLGTATKSQMEQEAKAAAEQEQVKVFWLAPVDENDRIIPGPNDGIPLDSVFYSSVDLRWQPLKETKVFLSSVHQVGAETGTVFISWNNGRGRLFPYTAEQYEEICSQVRLFRERYIRETMTDFEKEMQIVQYLAANVSYPYERYRTGTDTREDHCAYGALVRGEAVCEGYAEAFCWLADCCGLESRFLYGVYEKEMHDWNLVRLDGQWYHLDLTSDDTVERDGKKNGYGWGRLRNRYINRTDEEMLQDHQWQPFADIVCQEKRYGAEAVKEYLKRYPQPSS